MTNYCFPGCVACSSLPGIDNEGIFTLRNVNDTDAIKNYRQRHKVKRAVIIGRLHRVGDGGESAGRCGSGGCRDGKIKSWHRLISMAFGARALVAERRRLYLEKAVASF